jgi:hypothetical protein
MSWAAKVLYLNACDKLYLYAWDKLYLNTSDKIYLNACEKIYLKKRSPDPSFLAAFPPSLGRNSDSRLYGGCFVSPSHAPHNTVAGPSVIPIARIYSQSIYSRYYVMFMMLTRLKPYQNILLSLLQGLKRRSWQSLTRYGTCERVLVWPISDTQPVGTSDLADIRDLDFLFGITTRRAAGLAFHFGRISRRFRHH